MNHFKILVADGKGNVDIAELEIIVRYAFESSGVVNDSRFYAEHIDTGNWIKRDAAWSMTGGSLVNPGVVSNDEKGAHLINSVDIPDTSLTKVTVSFDYSVGAGSTLYFYSSLLTGELTGDFLSARLSKTGGAWFASDFNNDVSAYGGFSGSEYNLTDGSTPSGNVGTEVASFTGGTSGTFSQTFDISGFGSGDFSIADVSHVLAVFAADTAAAGNGAMSIDDFKITIDWSLRAHWALDESSGTVASDSSGLGRDATVANGTWMTGVNGNSLDFNGSDSTMTLPESAFSTISEEITIAMWVYGGSTLPKKSSILYAEDASGKRCLNVMLPWSNGGIYFDAGDSTGYDRIVKTAATNEYKDQWNHWVFTKNATTGVMNMYLNGTLWHTGTGKTKPIGTITDAVLGSRIGRLYYDGAVDDLKVFNQALSATEVNELYMD